MKDSLNLLIYTIIIIGFILFLGFYSYVLSRRDIPKYKVGDCALNNREKLEFWEKPTFEYPERILAVGENKYFISYTFNNISFYTKTYNINAYDVITHKVPCMK